MPRSLTVLAALLFAFTLSARELEPPKAGEKWITFETDGFRFISSASPRVTQEIARDLLRMRAAVGQVTRLRVRTAEPTRVYIFPSARRFAPYRESALDVKNENITGVFVSTSSGGNFILLQSDADSGVDRVVYHELTHQFVANTTAGLPLWFNEGMAEYYSTFRTVGEATHIGRPVEEHVRWLRSEKLIPLRELFATTYSSPTYNEAARAGAFYAQSWALVHYLMTDPERRAQLGRFLNLLGGGKSVDEAFAGAFGMEFNALEQALRAYIRGVNFTYNSYALGDLATAELAEPVAMPYDEVLQQLGYLLAHSRTENAEAAERFFKEALAANPANATAHANLGRIYDLTGRPVDADAAYEKAVQLGSTDAEVYLMAGRALLGRGNPRLYVKARALLQRATEVDPKSSRAWAALGSTYMGSDGERAAGIAALEKSVELEPANDEASFYLAQLLARESRYDDARKLAKTVLARTHDQSMQGHVGNMLAEVDRIEAANRIVDAINEAVTNANAGRYEAALAILDAVLPAIQDAAMLQEARSFREQVASRVKGKK